jgi:hypothetical protein
MECEREPEESGGGEKPWEKMRLGLQEQSMLRNF